ncbi:hypothetical protein LX36DRAFT_167210 [Colletotrichum falcatum]|nr:hypothetical protein LX36DRAFT_167210 [Colletotrichum falcatum]
MARSLRSLRRKKQPLWIMTSVLVQFLILVPLLKRGLQTRYSTPVACGLLSDMLNILPVARGYRWMLTVQKLCLRKCFCSQPNVVVLNLACYLGIGDGCFLY